MSHDITIYQGSSDEEHALASYTPQVCYVLSLDACVIDNVLNLALAHFA